MKLIEVKSAERGDGVLLLVILADLEDGTPPQEYPFNWHPADAFGLGPACGAWLAAHPEELHSWGLIESKLLGETP